MFFNSKKVIGAVDRATRKVFSKFGAFVRTTAKQSIKKPGKRAKARTSRPGRPPFSQTGLLKKFIFFGYDYKNKTVVIGPSALNKGTKAPEVLEYGGTTTRGRGKNKRKIKIAARPYMGPAFEKEKPKLPAMWANSVK